MEKELKRKRLEEQSLALAEVHSQLREPGTGLRRRKSGKSSSALVPYSLTPRDKIAKKAMLEIEKIKLTLKEKRKYDKTKKSSLALKLNVKSRLSRKSSINE